MHLLYLMVTCAAVACSAAYYHDSPHAFGLRDVIESRNVIENYDTAVQKRDEELVACPVCDQFLDEECTVLKNGKRYKKCMFGTYINEVCGNQRDCYRGPKQYCTEKMVEDKLGAKCAHGYMCNAQLHECVGLFNELDSLQLAGLRHYYILPEDNTNSYINNYPLARSRHAY